MANAHITLLKKSFSIEGKRIYLPLSISAECPYCGEMITNIYTKEEGGPEGHYFSDIVFNTPMSMGFCHDYHNKATDKWEEHEFEVEGIVFNVTLDSSKLKAQKYVKH